MNEVNLIIGDIVMGKGSKIYKSWKSNPDLIIDSLDLIGLSGDEKNKMIRDKRNLEISLIIDRLNLKIKGKNESN